MIARHMILTVTMALLMLTGAGQALARGESDARELASRSNAFGWSLYQQLADKPGNLFISPHSMHTAVSMAHLGAAGNTEDQMTRTLALLDGEGEPKPDLLRAYPRLLSGTPNMAGINPKPNARRAFQLQTANAIWAQQGYALRDAYLKDITGTFGSGLREVDFRSDAEAARKTINKWVEEQTQGRIRNLLPDGAVDDATRLVLTNAVYFKADWASTFKMEVTRDAPFTLGDGSRVQVKTMHQSSHYGYVQDDTARVLSMPYAGGEVTMLIVLPREADGLADVEKQLSNEQVSRWIAGLKRQKVDLALPKFKVEASYDMKPALAAMGMIEAFAPGLADFSGIDGSRDLYVSAVVHKTFVAVDEKGTEAAAATGLEVAATDMPMPEETITFKADRPFVYVIRHEPTGTILFAGRLADPR